MSIFWYIGYGVAALVIAFDAYLEFSGKKSLSEYVWESAIPNWLWYVLALIAVNVIFWFVSPLIAAIAVGFFLLGHFSQ